MSELRYAGFGPRFSANLIDFLIFVPISIGLLWLDALSWEVALVVIFLRVYFSAIYNVYFHGRWGRSIGKFVMKIRVTKLNGESIVYKQAFYRYSVDLCLATISIIALLMGMLSMSKSDYETADFVQRTAMVQQSAPFWNEWIGLTGKIWFWSEVVVLLFNKKRRAIHDFIAGTVVIHMDNKEKR